MTESYTPREFINQINAENPGPVFDPYGVEGLRLHNSNTTEQDILAQAKERVAEEKAKTPEGQIAELERQVEDMKQWLLEDDTYTSREVNVIIQNLSVEYDEDKQKAVVRGSLNLGGLTSADGLELPDSISGDLYLGGLTSADGLELPDSISGNLYLRSLTSAEGLTLPTSIDGNLYLSSLTSADGLELPDSIGGNLYLGGLTTAERDQIRAQRPDLRDKIRPS